ncbi:MAG: hypothetical protein HOI59_11680 [Nitrospina sp.]|jgi:hypothetical protein|nr:hypothetical protein [Nitrospina sp.]MBT3415810.1 hypothetical protein [Nitrospina sp.]MBT3855550.1 hypothetical protein [Nitrospina sp.]MBT4104104.1 hypothetical protein [Nitrospina sp.]MBT4390697.1 hypothetical protein [Nitrospina sp.]
MITAQYSAKDRKKKLVLTIFLTLGLFFVQTPKTYAADICKEGLKELQDSLGVIQDKGGIWGYLEKSSNLKNDSMIGLQIDGKLQRLVVSFETLCSEGKTPTPKLYNLILNLIGDTRVLFNKDADRQPKEKVLENLQGLNKKIEALLAQLP